MKPEWLEDEKLASCSDEARVLSVALILMSDDYGNGRASMATIATTTWRFAMERDDGIHAPEVLKRASRAFQELLSAGFVQAYKVSGQRYFAIRNWAKHQKVMHPGKPHVPGPEHAENKDESEGSREPHENLMRTSCESQENLMPDLRTIGPKDPEGEGDRATPPPTPRRLSALDFGGQPSEDARAALNAAVVAAGGSPRPRGGYGTQSAWSQVACDAHELSEALGVPVAVVLAVSARGFVAKRGVTARVEWWHERLSEYYDHGKAGAVRERKPGEMAPVGDFDGDGTSEEAIARMFPLPDERRLA